MKIESKKQTINAQEVLIPLIMYLQYIIEYLDYTKYNFKNQQFAKKAKIW